MSLALSNYIANRLNRRVAYLEYNDTHEIYSISDKVAPEVFSFIGIDYYPAVTDSVYTQLVNNVYDLLIVDLGILTSSNKRVFLEADAKIFLGSISPWRVDEYISKIRELKTNLNERRKGSLSIQYLLVNGIKDQIKYYEKITSVKFHSLPYITNPFRLKPADFIFFEDLLQEL